MKISLPFWHCELKFDIVYYFKRITYGLWFWEKQYEMWIVTALSYLSVMSVYLRKSHCDVQWPSVSSTSNVLTNGDEKNGIHFLAILKAMLVILAITSMHSLYCGNNALVLQESIFSYSFEASNHFDKLLCFTGLHT